MKPGPLTFPVVFLFVLWSAAVAIAAPDDWAEGSPQHNDGANHTFYNRAARLPWRHSEGDWRDASGKPQGHKPFAAANIPIAPTPLVIEWDVTPVVREWHQGKSPNKGFLLRNLRDSGNVRFHSREAEVEEDRPQLVLEINSQPVRLAAVADTHLVRSTYRPQGNSSSLTVADKLPALVRFDLSKLKGDNPPAKATLRLVSFKQYAAAEIGVFACDQGETAQSPEPLLGIAAQYPGDRGMENDPQVIFATGFESPDWRKEWTHVGGKVDTVDDDPEQKFEALSGKACRALLAQGELTAMNQTYQFQKQVGFEPEEIYFRYYLRLGDSWKQTVEGGKMPGISGTYGRAGWGGRKVNGRNGWSARGLFLMTLPEGNPLAGRHPLGWYCYHADMPGTYGDHWVWTEGHRGYLENNRWYCIEQYVKLNAPGVAGGEGHRDGILRVWIDGRPAFEKTDIRFRDVNDLKIEQIWMNVYHGGTTPSPYDQHVYVDNVVVAKKYIGPMQPQAHR